MPAATAQAEKECPLCLEQLDLYEKNFYPCKCGYQVCQFCWNRIKEDENNLCPACRHPYTDVPVDLKPVSSEEWKKILSDKKKRDQQRKTKMPENRKHLANYRVVQKNLVLIHGVPLKLADPDTLKKSDYFGQFGKVHRIVVGNTPNGNHTQNPSVGVYVTYYKEEDAVKAIINLNQRQLDGRTLKASLGTTKYCSLFLQNKPCQKQDCMYLHHVAEIEASFTKEDMAAKKHEEYERKACDEIRIRLNITPTPKSSQSELTTNEQSSESVVNEKINGIVRNTSIPPRFRKSDQTSITNTNDHQTNRQNSGETTNSLNINNNVEISQEYTVGSIFSTLSLQANENSLFSNDDEAYIRPKIGRLSDNFVGQNSNDEIKLTENCKDKFEQGENPNENGLGFEIKDDDLGFDPYTESSKGLEDLVRQEKEQVQQHMVYLQQLQQTNRDLWHPSPPPGLPTPAIHKMPIFYQKDQFYQSILPESRRFYNSESANPVQQMTTTSVPQPTFACWTDRMVDQRSSMNARSIPQQVPHVYYNSSLLNKWSPSELNICLNSRSYRSQPFVQLQTNCNGLNSHSTLRNGFSSAPVTNGWVP